jgi:UDP-glucose 4-epimerase
MTVLVIGGSGFIGQWLVRRLADGGRAVRVLGRSAVPPHLQDGRAQYCRGDYGDQNVLKELLADVDEVVDLAYSTVPKSSFEDPVFDIQTNLPQAVTLLRLAAAQGLLRKLVLVSSGGTVYGHAGSTPIAETHPTNPVSPYGITKLAIEKYGLMFHALTALPVVVVRPANAYGEGQLPFRGQGFIATAGASFLQQRKLTVFGGSEVVRDYIHVDDIAAGIVAALEAGTPGGCYNIGTGVGTGTDNVLAMVSELARSAGLEPEVERQPARAFDVRVNVLDSSKLTRETGWRPTVPLAVGLDRTWRWLAAAQDGPRPGRSG